MIFLPGTHLAGLGPETGTRPDTARPLMFAPACG